MSACTIDALGQKLSHQHIRHHGTNFKVINIVRKQPVQRLVKVVPSKRSFTFHAKHLPKLPSVGNDGRFFLESDGYTLPVDISANPMLAEKLEIGSVKSHIKIILEKLGAASRTEAASIAQRKHLLESGESLSP